MNYTNNYESMKKYEFFDVTADIGFFAYGNTINEAYENAGLAVFNVISNTENIEIKEFIDIYIESEDKVSLLYDYLEELLFLHETRFMLFSNFNIKIEKEGIGDNVIYKLIGRVGGEKINWLKHYRGSEVKAITFHKMKVFKKDKYFLRVILDL